MKTSFLAAAALCLGLPAAFAQQSSSSTGTPANQVNLSGRAGQNGSVTTQESAVPGTTQSVDTLNSTVSVQGPYAQSTLGTKPLQGSLSLREAVQRGLEYNLGTIGQSNASLQAHGQLLVARSALLPHLDGSFREVVQKSNLAAQGLRVAIIPQVVGPYNYFDLRLALTQNVVDLTARNNLRSAQDSLKATSLAAKDAHDLVVLAVGAAYLQAIAAQARVVSAQAQVVTAKAVYEQTRQQGKAGLKAQIDVNRDLVTYQTQQQRLTTIQNDLAKQKINLARIVGLSVDTPLELSDTVPFAPSPELSYEDAVRAALATRADLQSAGAAVQAANRAHAAAVAERLPSLSVSGDYGSIGVNPAQGHGTYNVTGTVRIPIFQGGKVQGDVEQSTAAVRQRGAEFSETKERVKSEVKSAYLDLASSQSQLQVAESNRKVSHENLDLTRQRLESGIADSVEVTQAQETVANSELDYITSLLAFNLAKLSIARALGDSESRISQYLVIP